MHEDRFREEAKKEFTRLERVAMGMFGCTLENYRSLKERIEKTDGRVTVLVHPFYEYEHARKPPENDTLKDRLDRVTKSLEERISGMRKYEVPVIVLQEKNHLPRRDLHLLGAPEQNIFFIPTADSDPMPLFSYSTQLRRGPDSLIGGWRETIDVLKDLKVKEIEIGGMYLWGEFGGCVGATRKVLGKEFPVRLSQLTFPDRVAPWNNNKVM